jgi:dGTPase
VRVDYRNPTQIDRDRILYSSALSRMAEITQVVSADYGYVYHNRLTHSLKVAQLARRIAEKLLGSTPRDLVEAIGGLDPDAAESAALAHDLGHPPYGHIGEEELNQEALNRGLADGFEGNAQSFRIVCSLAVGDGKTPDRKLIRGLNLTRATLNGILKYPWLHHQNAAKLKKWGVYNTERDIFEWVRSASSPRGFARSAEAEVMDLADDISYAVHDLTDFVRTGQIPLDSLKGRGGDNFLEEVCTRCPELGTAEEVRKCFSGLVQVLLVPDHQYDGSLAEQQWLWQQVTVLISRYVDQIKLIVPKAEQESCLLIDAEYRRELGILAQLTWHFVILSRDLQTVQFGQRRVVHEVLQILLDATRDKSRWNLFPRLYRDELDHAENTKDPPQTLMRVAVDYVAGMAEHELERIHDSLTGRLRN